MGKLIELKKDVHRNAAGIKCPCGGYADRAELTEEETSTAVDLVVALGPLSASSVTLG